MADFLTILRAHGQSGCDALLISQHMLLFLAHPPPDGRSRPKAGNMKIEMNEGLPVIDAVDLSRLLGLTVDDVRAKMAAAEITSRYETGEGEDAGKFRLTFLHAGKRLRLTCSDDGTVLKTTRINAGAR